MNLVTKTVLDVLSFSAKSSFSAGDFFIGVFMKERNLIIHSFADAFSFSSLLDMHQKCRSCKSHKREVVEFELNLDRNLIKLSNDILTGKYTISHYRKFFVYEPKKRVIESLNYKHRLVQAVLCKKILEPVLERHLIEANCACRCSKGTDYARKLLYNYLKKIARKYKDNAYVLKCDVSKYFASINHNILINKLEKLNFEDKVMNLLKIIIDSHNSESGVGIPIGNQTSQWFALFYLDEIDRIIKEKFKCKFYVRYMDDLVIIDNDLFKLKLLKKTIINSGEKLKLSFNKKTQICRISQGFGFIGHNYSVNFNGKILKKIKQSSKIRLKTAFKRIAFLFANNLVTNHYIMVRLACYNSYYTTFYEKQYLLHILDTFGLSRRK